MVGDAASGRMYKGWQGKLAQLLIYSLANLLVGYLCYYTSASTLPPSWVIKDILLAVGFKLCTSKAVLIILQVN